MIKNISMRVNPDLSRRVQEIVFKNGGKWMGDYTDIRNLKEKILLVDEYGMLAYYSILELEMLKYDIDGEEISAYDFIASQGEQKWLPKYNEICEFSDDKNFRYYKALQFKRYNPEDTYPFEEADGNTFRYCRPLKQTKTITIDGKDIEVSSESFEALKEQLCKKQQ